MSETLESNNVNLDTNAKKAGIWYTVGNILLKGCMFFTLPIFTHLMSTSDFGIYNTYIAYEGIITAVIGLGLYGTIKSAKIDYGDKFNEYISSIISMSYIWLVVILLLSNIVYPFYSKYIGFDIFMINMLIFQSFGNYLLGLYGAKLNIEFKYKSYVFLSFFNTILNIVLSILLIKYVFVNNTYLGRIIGSAVPLIVIGIIITILSIKKGKKIVSKKYWKYSLIIGLPLIPHVVSHSLLSQFDRIMISNMIGTSESGIYSYIYTLSTIVYVIVVSLDNAWSSWAFININQNNEVKIKETSKKYILFFTLLSIGFICLMPEVARLMGKKNYLGGIDLIVPLTFANYFIFMYMFPVCIEYYNKKTKYISIGTVCAAVLNIILNFVFIQKFGYKAAAYTTFISYLLLFLFHWVISKKFKIDKYYDIRTIIKYSVILIIIGIILLATLNYKIISLVIRYLITLIVICILYKNKNLFVNLVKGNRK